MIILILDFKRTSTSTCIDVVIVIPYDMLESFQPHSLSCKEEGSILGGGTSSVHMYFQISLQVATHFRSSSVSSDLKS